MLPLPHLSSKWTFLKAATFLCIFLFFFFAFISYTPEDPSIYHLFQPYQDINNWVHLPGAILASLFFYFFGYTSFSLLFCFSIFQWEGLSSLKTAIYAMLLPFLSATFISSLSFTEKETYRYAGVWGIFAQEELFQRDYIAIASIVCIAIYLVMILQHLRWNSAIIRFVLFTFTYIKQSFIQNNQSYHPPDKNHSSEFIIQ